VHIKLIGKDKTKLMKLENNPMKWVILQERPINDERERKV